MIGYCLVKVFDKHRTKLFEIEVVGSTKEEMETAEFQQKKAIKNAGYDTNTDKWGDMSKFIFEATLIKNLSD